MDFSDSWREDPKLMVINDDTRATMFVCPVHNYVPDVNHCHIHKSLIFRLKWLENFQ